MSAPEWLVPGAEVIVTQVAMFGADVTDAQRGVVAKVGKLHFTVEGVREGFSEREGLPLVKFSVVPRMLGHTGAADSRMRAYSADDPDGQRKLAMVERETAESEVWSAHDRWRKACQLDRRATPDGDRAAALFELADAITALRGVYDAQGIVADQPNVD